MILVPTKMDFYLRFLSFSVLVVSSAAYDHVVHEERSAPPPGWSKTSKPAQDHTIPIRIGLAQSNLDDAHNMLMDVSDPVSLKFGQHWTPQQVFETFAPSQEAIDSVRNWLVESGIDTPRIRLSSSQSWVQANLTVSEAEDLLRTEYNIYEHVEDQRHVACESYSVPSHLKRYIDLITPTVHFDIAVNKPHAAVYKRAPERSSAGPDVRPGVASSVGSPNNGFLPKPGRQINIKGIIQQLENCDEYIVPNCLRALYRFPPGTSSNRQNSYGIVEYSPQAYRQADLDLFFQNFSSRLVGRPPIFDSIDNGVAQTSMTGFDYNGESDLDLEYAMSLVYPVNVTVYQVGDVENSGSFNTFLDAIDGSYCTYEGGDDPTQDPEYPNQDCGTFAPAKVISTSYGYNEADLTPAYEQRQCNEYMKLGLMGTTVVFSSGDYGVAGNGGACIDPTTRQFNDGTSGLFNPAFPSTCPYVTSIGATQVNPGSSVLDPESACEQVIFSGGGFSNVFPMPSYQSDAVATYYSDHNPPYGADRYNNSQQVRGYPDISANGANYVVAVDGNFSLVYGTSASAPTVGSIVTLINEARFAAGKGAVGFVNPTLYSNPSALNDITSGGNQGCGTAGFTSVQGWDPVTGLGTPNFPNLLRVFLNLP